MCTFKSTKFLTGINNISIITQHPKVKKKYTIEMVREQRHERVKTVRVKKLVRMLEQTLLNYTSFTYTPSTHTHTLPHAHART